MVDSVIHYDKDLPEIPGRLPWKCPTQHLIKDNCAQCGWRVADDRRPSNLLLTSKIRKAVDQWRDQGYPGVSNTTRRLLHYWFEDEHKVDGKSFRFHFCQREAMETLIWLVEIKKNRDCIDLIETFGEIYSQDLVAKDISFNTLTDGRRQVIRYVEELNRAIPRDLPPQDLRRYAFKLATGSGKTWVMAMTVVWSYFHKKWEKNSDLTSNFLIVAPNVIVYQRLEKDLANRQLFYRIPMVPPEWRRQFLLKIILRNESVEPDAHGNLFLTNIHQLYESREQEWIPRNAVEVLLGNKPETDNERSNEITMLNRIKSLADVMVMNDEAHHVHDDSLEWNKSLLSIHKNLPNGLSMWLDFSATPKDEAGYFPWCVCDYPLAQAVEDHIIKSPIIAMQEKDQEQPDIEPDDITEGNAVEKYGYWLKAAIHRWKKHRKVYRKLEIKPVLFIMTEKSPHADAIGKFLWESKEFKKNEVLVIHTNTKGEITKKDLDQARLLARNIDEKENEIKAIVSVLMLREGWDVRNVTVVLGLRPYTSKAEILPEQVIGRGLRLMKDIGPELTQTLEVMGTPRLLEVLRTQLEDDGVGVKIAKEKEPLLPVIITPLKERIEYDICAPITKPRFSHEIRNLDKLDILKLKAIFAGEMIDRKYRMELKMEFQTTETPVHYDQIEVIEPLESILTTITNMVMQFARITGCFAKLYPKLKKYVEYRCFGRKVDLDSNTVLSHLSRSILKQGIAKYLAAEIGKLLLEKRSIEFQHVNYKLSLTNPFAWRRDLPPLVAKKTVFNYVATYNKFERSFAEFLDRAKDVPRFAAFATTEQGDSGVQFRIDYLKESGAIGFYHPDWVAIQNTSGGEINWIIETKGRIWDGTHIKDKAALDWCERVSEATGNLWRYVRVNQSEFEENCNSLHELIRKAFRENKYY